MFRPGCEPETSEYLANCTGYAARAGAGASIPKRQHRECWGPRACA
jgi:hypothetical protein